MQTPNFIWVQMAMMEAHDAFERADLSRPSPPPGQVALPTWGNDHVIPGLIDENAEIAYSNGQCHALALALHRLTGWSLVLVYDLDPGEEPFAHEMPYHVAVLTDDDGLLDIRGLRDIDEAPWYAEAEVPEVLGLARRGYRRPVMDIALTFAVALLDQEDLLDRVLPEARCLLAQGRRTTARFAALGAASATPVQTTV